MLGERLQLGYVVSDLDEALRFWTQKMRVGPFVVIEDPVGEARFVHRGQDSNVCMRVAFSYVGDTMIELILQTSDGPSPYLEFLKAGRSGLHHIAYWPRHFETALIDASKAGFVEIASMHTPENEQGLGYLDAPPEYGIMIEIVRMTAARQKYYRGIQRLAETWDGERPVRRFATYADYMASADCSA